MTRSIELFYMAHSRTGDKGNDQTMSLIPYRPEDFSLLKELVTVEAVKAHFGELVKGKIQRYELPNLSAFNFVLNDSLDGGVNGSLGLDTHGKARSSFFLSMKINIPDGHPCQKVNETI